MVWAAFLKKGKKCILFAKDSLVKRSGKQLFHGLDVEMAHPMPLFGVARMGELLPPQQPPLPWPQTG